MRHRCCEVQRCGIAMGLVVPELVPRVGSVLVRLCIGKRPLQLGVGAALVSDECQQQGCRIPLVPDDRQVEGAIAVQPLRRRRGKYLAAEFWIGLAAFALKQALKGGLQSVGVVAEDAAAELPSFATMA